MNETLAVDQQNWDTYDGNTDNLNGRSFPEMIISDLDSAFLLLQEFPDSFITYFDEAFAASVATFAASANCCADDVGFGANPFACNRLSKSSSLTVNSFALI